MTLLQRTLDPNHLFYILYVRKRVSERDRSVICGYIYWHKCHYGLFPIKITTKNIYITLKNE